MNTVICSPGIRARGLLLRQRGLAILIVSVLVIAQAITGDVPGLTVRPASAPYLNVPSAPPIPNGNFSAAVAFENLSFQGAIAIRPVPGTNRLWVLEREGRIWSFENDPATTTKTLVLDLNDDDVNPNEADDPATPTDERSAGHVTGTTRWWCQGWDDCGLMGLAFHPQFAQAGSPNRGYFYLGYQAKSVPPTIGSATADYRPDSSSGANNTSNRVARFTLPDNSASADPRSEQILIDQPDRNLWHNGGDLFFDQAGYLFCVNGDEGSAYDPYQNSQRITKGLFSGMLRIDVDWTAASTRSHQPPPRQAGQPLLRPGYGIPNDNPFVGIPGALEEFYAIGLRSPHRATYDAPSGTILVGDVGQAKREEISRIIKGGNYQWGYQEGFANRAVDGSIKYQRIPPTWVAANAVAVGALTIPLRYTAPTGDTTLPPGQLAVGDRVRFGNQVRQIASLPAYPYASVTLGTALGQGINANTPMIRTTGFTVTAISGSTPVDNQVPSGLGTTTLSVSGPGLLSPGTCIAFPAMADYGSFQIIAASDNGTTTASITVRPALPNAPAIGSWIDRLTVLGSEQPPVVDFNHGGAYNFYAIIGGYIYRGATHPDLQGRYLFADNISGSFYALNGIGTMAPTVTKLFDFPGYQSGPGGYRGISGFGLDQNNELLICSMQQPNGAVNQATGKIWKLIRLGGTVIGTPIPTDLAATGAFATDGAGNLVLPLKPAPALIPHGVNSPLWSDLALKSRWISLPNRTGKTSGFDPVTEQVTFSPTGALSFPAGTVFVKHFELEDYAFPPHNRRMLETRLLVRSPDNTVYGVTYKWNDSGTQALLLNDGLDQTYDITEANGTTTHRQTWSFPSRADCLSCHNSNANHVLGVNSRQLNGRFTYPAATDDSIYEYTGTSDNQLHTWSVIGMFANPPADNTIPTLRRLVPVQFDALTNPAPAEDRVRSWLDANCAQCHRPGGVHAQFDARYDTALVNQGLIDGAVYNTLGVVNARVIAPGNLTRSLLHVRANSLAAGTKMPPLAKNLVDTAAMSAMAEWIMSLSPGTNAAPNVNAGSDLTVTLPTSVTLTATVSDDGLPSGSTLTAAWTMVSGAGSVTFGNAGAVTTTASFSTAGTYVLRLTVNDTALSSSDDVQVVVNPASGTGTMKINAGGAAQGGFTADTDFSGGMVATTTTAILTSGVSEPAPEAVYQSERFGNFTYTVDGLTPSSACTVRLHFAEIYWTAAGKRIFNVAVNGTPVLTNFDIHAAAGGAYIALVRDFPATSNPAGIVTISFTTVVDHAKLSGLEIRGASTPTNVAPSVQAGADLAITQPASANLDGTVTDDGLPSGATVTSVWSLVSGPGSVTFGNANAVDTTATFSTAGTYVLRLTANDSALTASDDVQVVANNASTTSAIRVNAGGSAQGGFAADVGASGGWIASVTIPIVTTGVGNPAPEAVYQSERFGNFSYTIVGLTPGSAYNVRLHFAEIYWTAVGKRVFNVAINGAVVLANFDVFASAGGAFKALVREFTATSSATGTITISFTTVVDHAKISGIEVLGLGAPVNRAPTANAGTDQAITLPAAATLAGTVSDDGLPNGLTQSTWTKLSGPGTVTFGNAASATSTATFSLSGTYVLRLSASDGALTTSDDVQVVVNPAASGNTAPTVNAGADQAITLPAAATLAGTVSDDGLPNGLTQSNWTKLSGPGTVTFGNAASATSTAAFSLSGTYVLRLSASDSVLTTSDDVTITVLSANQSGQILREWWTGVGGTAVSDLTSLVTYPAQPSGSGLLSSFEIPTNVMDNYGTRVRGYVIPPTSGTYVFWIAGDDNCQLFLGTSAAPVSKVQIATVPGWTSSREWGKYPAQQSAPITLTAGVEYYVEALHKEGGGGDNLAVGWQLPGGTLERPLPGNRLKPFDPAAFVPPQVALIAPDNGAQYTAPANITLSASATDADGQVVTVEFLQNTVVVATLNTPPWSTTRSALATGYYSFAARATDNHGQQTTSTTRSVTVLNADGTGALRREWWNGITGNAVNQLTNAPGYPGTPAGSDLRSLFEAPINWADNYGTRMTGYVVAPLTGSYVFWIAGDDNCELWLSNDDSPSARVLIARVPDWTTSREWTKSALQQSAPIALTAGARYWIEALHKEGGGGDSLAVGWQLPGGALERPIPGNRLIPPVISVTTLTPGWSVRRR